MREKELLLKESYEKKGYVNILSLTGGGCYGYGQALILDDCDDIGKFDVIAGTSIGGLNALMVGSGECGKMAAFYDEHAKEIFGGSWWKKIKPYIWSLKG
jgi:patatin-like phospholipase/acyl hydrolase